MFTAGLRERPDRVGDVGRLIRPAPARHGRQVRAVSLSQDAFRGDAFRGLAQLLCAGVGDVAGERDVVVALERDVEEPR